MGSSTDLERLRAAADEHARWVFNEALNPAPLGGDAVLSAYPVMLERTPDDDLFDGSERDNLSEVLTWWLRDEPHVAGQSLIVDAPIGSGKSVGVSALHQHFKAAAPNNRVVDILLRLRDTDIVDTDPCAGVLSTLRTEGNVPLLGQPVRLLVLDGFDEILLKTGRKKALDWLQGLLDRLKSSRALRVVVTSRDTTLREGKLREGLRNALATLPMNGPLPPQRRVREVRLKPWEDSFSRKLLAELLGNANVRNPDETINQVMTEKLQLTSPLLLRLAYVALRPRGGRQSAHAPAPIETEHQLVMQAVDTILDERPDGVYCDRDLLRRTVENISLAITGTEFGASGLTLNELDSPAYRWAIQEFQNHFADRGPEAWRLALSRLALLSTRPHGLTAGTSVVTQDENVRLAPFHPRVTQHLAVAAMLRRGGNNPDPDTDTGGGGPDAGGDPNSRPRLPGGSGEHPFAAEFGPRIGQPNLARVAEFLSARFFPTGLDPNAPFNEVLGLWADAVWPESEMPLTVVTLPPLALAQPPPDTPSRPDPGLQVSLRDPFVGRAGIALPPAREARAATAEVELGGARFLPIPPATYPVWHAQGPKSRVIDWMPIGISEPVYLGTDLVTAGQYAEFLNDPRYRQYPLPNQPEARWRRVDADKAAFDVGESDPVTGLSVDDAREFCEWLTRMVGNGEPEITLPTADELRAALGGRDLLPPRYALAKQPERVEPSDAQNTPNTPGPFGHRNLGCKVWQWTDDGRLFGGSDSLDPNRKNSPSLLAKWYPDLTGDPLAKHPGTIGFRVALRGSPPRSKS